MIESNPTALERGSQSNERTLRRALFVQGARTVAPILVAIVPFAVVSGVVARATGLSLAQTMFMSLWVFAGASQLAALDLMERNAPALVIIGTAFLINLRFLMYSASLGVYFRRASLLAKSLVGYLHVDHVYAISVTRFADEPRFAGDERTGRRVWFYLGMGITMWATWQLGTLAGALVGAGLPESWSLDFVIPLMFLAILVPVLRDRHMIVAAIVGGVVALIGAGLPFNLGLVIASLVGIGAGVASERFSPLPPRRDA